MFRSITTKAIGLCIAVLVTAAAGIAQPAPFLQDIKVRNTTPTPYPSSTPLVKKTGGSTMAGVPSSNAVRTMFPALAAVEIPGYSGVIVETLDGKIVLETNSGLLFNPASNVKVATTYAVLKTFGPEFRFQTMVYTDGAIDRNTGTLNGNVYVSGKDPIFGFEHAVAVANELNRLGIRTVMGDLIVTDNFAMNYSGSSLNSAKLLSGTLDASKRSAGATRVWLNYLSYSGKYGQVSGVPSVYFSGATYVQPIPSNLQLLFTHESAPLREIIKAMMCYSNNFLSERLGEMLGGPFAVSRVVQQNAGIAPNEFSLATSSGLGFNRVTPNAMMKLLRALRNDLSRYKMTFVDVMPVAGIDNGTLAGRFDSDFAPGSVVGKTGTLPNTDAGVSALSGEINTRNGKLLFVIFNQRGSVPRFRAFQNSFVSLVQGQFGGAQSIGYQPTSLDVLLARTRIVNPRGQSY
ncbi:MAG: D-alanyl-D-alanine carboxypeptidase [Pyrinomonadaceae bacterium]|nr:D-alanyl-D-alanine carboxypeptidase [Acidobacteriota bacterium]MBK7932202.1 D-alanyl-D-alanine carboxypeptidase [Acidobacteriota bacterium]MBP7376252.1 D-alanyl-D-alanine carboxypeptidase [Pyrinomonadaceae bacterium]